MEIPRQPEPSRDSGGGPLSLEAAFNAIQGGVCILGRDMRILRVNSWMESMYREAGPLVGRKCYDVFHGKEGICPWCPTAAAMEKGERCSAVVPYRYTAADTGWLEVAAYPLRDEGGRVVGAVEYVRDASDKQRTQAVLETSRAFLESVSDGMLLLDIETGAVVEANSRLAAITGYSLEELRRMSVADLAESVPPYSAAEAFQRLLAAGEEEPTLFEWHARDRNGRLFWIEVSARRVQIDNIPRIVASVRDVTRRKAQEEELLRVREALDDCGSAALIVDINLRATYLNAAFGSQFGFTHSTAGDVRLGPLFAEPEEAHQAIRCIRQGEGWQGEIQMVNRMGRPFPASVRITPVLNDAFEASGALLILNDITERKHMEAQLIQSQNLKAIGQLAAGIAHEINTPIQYVGDNTRFLRDAFQDLLKLAEAYRAHVDAARTGALNEELEAALDAAVAAADMDYLSQEVPLAISQSMEGIGRVTDIVRAMRQFVHPGSSGKAYVDLNQAIMSTITVARNEWKYVAELETEFDTDLPSVPCCPGDINQVMLNLIVNASHAIADVVGDGSKQRGRITISTRRAGRWAEIRVADTGRGVPVAIRDRIFEPFFTTKEVGKGTGQGLAISHAVIVDRHGGTLSVESEEGQGATFVVRLPLSEAGTPSAAEAGATPAEPVAPSEAPPSSEKHEEVQP